MLACPCECRFRWWLLFVAISNYNCSVVAQITIQPLNLRVVVGEKASFECNSVEAVDNNIWCWYKVNLVSQELLWRENVNTSPRYAFLAYDKKYSSFTILNTTLDDDQTQYYCKYGSAASNTTTLAVEVTRLGQSYPQCESNITALNTKNIVTMTCKASGGDPRPSLQWYSNGEILTKQEDIVSNENGNVSYFDEFTREMTVEDETAIYTCRAEGLAVEGNQNCSISVATPPTVTIIANTIYFNAGDSLEFACIVMSPWNIIDYKWTVNNQLVTSSNAVFKNDKSTIIISNLQSGDAGKEIQCNALTLSGLNGNASVIISLFDVDQKNNTFQLITIVVGGVISLALLCVTVLLLIRQRQKQNRTNKAAVVGNNSIAHFASLDGQNQCISEENSANHGDDNSFPLSENPARFHHYDDHIDVNADQENVPRGRPSIGFPKSVSTASLESSESVDDLKRFDSNQKHISHKYNQSVVKDNHGFDDMYAHPFAGTRKTGAKPINDEPNDNEDIYAKPRKWAQNPDTRSFDGIVDFEDLYAKPVKEKKNPDTRSIDGITDFGDLYAKPIKHRKSIHQSLEDIAGTLKSETSPNRPGSIDYLYSQPNKKRRTAYSAQPGQTEHYAQPRSIITYNTTPNTDVNPLMPIILNDQCVQNISKINQDFTYSSIA